jgi:beta-lactam-binding protein with PASTA domain
MGLLQFIKSKLFLKQLFYAGIGIIIFVFIIMKWLNISTNHNQKIEVPNLEKLSLNAVEKALEELDLNFVVIDSASYNPNYPKKAVIDQDPEPGDFVKENRKIYLTLNPSGYKDVEIPNLFGKTKRQVTSQLRSIGFRVDEEVVYVSDIAEDVVRGLLFNNENLKAGDKIPKNSMITLKLGDGKGRGRYVQPSNEVN